MVPRRRRSGVLGAVRVRGGPTFECLAAGGFVVQTLRGEGARGAGTSLVPISADCRPSTRARRLGPGCAGRRSYPRAGSGGGSPPTPRTLSRSSLAPRRRAGGNLNATFDVTSSARSIVVHQSDGSTPPPPHRSGTGRWALRCSSTLSDTLLTSLEGGSCTCTTRPVDGRRHPQRGGVPVLRQQGDTAAPRTHRSTSARPLVGG
jgi:hypothetical protein